MKLFSGTSNEPLAKKVAEQMGTTLGQLEIIRFDDDECRVRMQEDVDGQEVVFIQSTPNPPDRYLMETYLFADSAKRAGASKITVVMPYFGYARQDKEHRRGESVSAAVVAKCLEVSGITKIITFDIHSKYVLSFFNKTLTEHESMLPEMVTQLVKDHSLDLANLGIFSPDQDGAHRARYVIQKIGGGQYGFVQKERDLDQLHTLRAIHGQRYMGEPKGKDIVLIDDMIASGGTIVEATKILKEEGAKRIFIVATHAIYIKDAATKMADPALEAVYLTDTISQPELAKAKNTTIHSTSKMIASMLK